MTIIAIDQGANGGIAWTDKDGHANAIKMPDTMTGMVDQITAIRAENPKCRAAIEDVGFHRSGNNAQASAKFARHCGQVEAALYCLGIPFESVTPARWQKPLSLPKDKEARKNTVKELMQRKFPHLRVTLATADALAILEHAKKETPK